jgi:hypothetical protein
MSSYAPMPLHLTTERLILQPWNESDADDLRALHAERGDGTPTIERTREIIARLLASAAETGIALLLIRRRAEGDFIGYCGLIVGRATVDEPEIAYELFQRVQATDMRPRRPARSSMPRQLLGANGSGRPSAAGTPHRCGSLTSSGSSATTSRPTTAVNPWSGSREYCHDPARLNLLRNRNHQPLEDTSELRP